MEKIARVLMLLCCLGLVAAPAHAADVDGTWAGTMSTPNGDFPIAFMFLAKGEALTGHMVGMDGEQIPIENGKVDGDKISYTVTVDFGGMPLEMSYTGVVAMKQIQLTMSVFDMPFELTVTKSE